MCIAFESIWIPSNFQKLYVMSTFLTQENTEIVKVTQTYQFCIVHHFSNARSYIQYFLC